MPPGAGVGPYGPMMGPGMPNPYAPQMYAVAPQSYQDPNAGMAPGGMAPGGMAPSPMPMPLPNEGYGEYPNSEYGGPAYGCESCGGYGCDTCGPFGGRLRSAPRILRYLLPYDDGGCCAPHWFDLHVEYVNLRRDDDLNYIGFTSDTPLGPIVLSTDDLNFDTAGGFRATVTRQIGVGSNLEFSYLGQSFFNSQAAVSSSSNSLFSVFSGYGSFPLAGQGFTETDQAAYQSISYGSNFDNLELNFRQRWQGYGCKLQGSWLMGVRYFDLQENFNYISLAPINSAQMDYRVDTSNRLTGFQIGGDIWACLVPGLTVGTEGKVGIYGNKSSQFTTIAATTINPTLTETADDTDAAFLGELGVMLNWRLNQSLTFRGGYQFLYVTDVALAPENFNSTPPFLVPAFTNPPRTPTITTGGEVFYHGFTAGLEYMW
jgi:hypothetical protein